MLNLSSLTTNANLQANFGSQSSESLAPSKDAAQEIFNDFVAGTFFKQMLKALRSTEGKTAYIDGGQAEKMFRSQMDQELAEDLADSHGEMFSKSLYSSFSTQLDKTV